MNPPARVILLLLTYARTLDSPRHRYAIRALDSALGKLSYTGGPPLAVHIADDGSGPGHLDALIARARDWGHEPSVTTARGRGYGANYNDGTMVAHQLADIVLPLEDDWELVRDLDLADWVAALTEPGSPLGCVRMGNLGWTQELRGRLAEVAAQPFLLFDPDSPEPHVFCGNPRLETVAWARRVGPWPEGLMPGETEFEVAHRRPAREGVGWPIGVMVGSGKLWGHIGTVQSQEERDHGSD